MSLKNCNFCLNAFYNMNAKEKLNGELLLDIVLGSELHNKEKNNNKRRGEISRNQYV